MTRFLTFAMVVVAFTAPVAALAADVKYDYDGSVDFSAWRTWAWKTPAAPTGGTPAEARIRRSLEAGFTARGYARTDRGADLFVEFHAGARRELRVDEGWGFRGRRDLRVDSYAKGVLIVDVLEARTGRLVWRGAVADALASDPAQADKKMEKAVTKLLRKFPASGSRSPGHSG